MFDTKESPRFANTLYSVIAMKNYASTAGKSSRGFLSSHHTVPFAAWIGKHNNIERDEEIKAALSFLLRHTERVIANAEPIHEVLDNLQELLARYQTLLDDPSISSAKTDALAELWMKVHGNKQRLKDLNRRLELLKDLKIHRGKLLGIVTATWNLTTAVVHQLEEMRESLQVGSA